MRLRERLIDGHCTVLTRLFGVMTSTGAVLVSAVISGRRAAFELSLTHTVILTPCVAAPLGNGTRMTALINFKEARLAELERAQTASRCIPFVTLDRPEPPSESPRSMPPVR